MPARLRETHPGTGVIMLGQYAQPSYALALLEQAAGRRADLLKERIRNKGDLIGAIERVAIGGSVIDPLVLDVLIKARSRPAHSRISQLTPRERAVLAKIAAGCSIRAIGDSLAPRESAVEQHLNSIFSKLDLPQPQNPCHRVTLMFLSEEEDGVPL
jgi:DNA-binding NarL/FixJ family response regulator